MCKLTYKGPPNTIALIFGTIYGDASGAEFSVDPLLRRIGVGLAAVDNDGNILWGLSFNLPGDVQTVPRGELYAIAQ